MDSTKQQATLDQPGHETRDVNLRLIINSLIALTILVIVVLGVIWGLVSFLAGQEAGRFVPLPPLAEEQIAPEPRLQAAPREDWQTMRAETDEILNNYGWVNKEAGVVHIPIEQAIEMTLEQGLPTQAAE